MKETKLTTNEIDKLTEEINIATNHRKAEIRKFSVIFPSCIFLASLFLILQTEMQFLNFILPITGVLSIMIGPSVLLVWSRGKRQIQRLAQDLQAGYKIEGISKAVSVNRLNQNVRLEDGTTINVLDQTNETCTVGEFVEYKISKSREVVFGCKKIDTTTNAMKDQLLTKRDAEFSKKDIGFT